MYVPSCSYCKSLKSHQPKFIRIHLLIFYGKIWSVNMQFECVKTHSLYLYKHFNKANVLATMAPYFGTRGDVKQAWRVLASYASGNPQTT